MKKILLIVLSLSMFSCASKKMNVGLTDNEVRTVASEVASKKIELNQIESKALMESLMEIDSKNSTHFVDFSMGGKADIEIESIVCMKSVSNKEGAGAEVCYLKSPDEKNRQAVTNEHLVSDLRFIIRNISKEESRAIGANETKTSTIQSLKCHAYLGYHKFDNISYESDYRCTAKGN